MYILCQIGLPRYTLDQLFGLHTTTDEDFDDTAVYQHADIQFRTRGLSRCDIISQFRVEQDAHTYADTDTDADADADADTGTLDVCCSL